MPQPDHLLVLCLTDRRLLVVDGVLPIPVQVSREKLLGRPLGRPSFVLKGDIFVGAGSWVATVFECST